VSHGSIPLSTEAPLRKAHCGIRRKIGQTKLQKLHDTGASLVTACVDVVQIIDPGKLLHGGRDIMRMRYMR